MAHGLVERLQPEKKDGEPATTDAMLLNLFLFLSSLLFFF